jgi:tetratricopeptide (TPR) repeat protein
MEPWWDVLYVSSNATLDEVEFAYRELAKRLHPDRWTSAPEKQRAMANAQMKGINAAYERAKEAICPRETRGADAAKRAEEERKSAAAAATAKKAAEEAAAARQAEEHRKATAAARARAEATAARQEEEDRKAAAAATGRKRNGAGPRWPFAHGLVPSSASVAIILLLLGGLALYTQRAPVHDGTTADFPQPVSLTPKKELAEVVPTPDNTQPTTSSILRSPSSIIELKPEDNSQTAAQERAARDSMQWAESKKALLYTGEVGASAFTPFGKEVNGLLSDNGFYPNLAWKARAEKAMQFANAQLKTVKSPVKPVPNKAQHQTAVAAGVKTASTSEAVGRTTAIQSTEEYYRKRAATKKSSQEGESDKAIADYTEAIRLDPKLAMAYCNRGVAYGSKGEYDKAIADCTEAIRLDPKLDLAYELRGLAYGSKGEYDKAIADYTEAIRLDPKFALTYHNRGLAYESKGDHDKAEADFAEAKRLGFTGK